jgi:hypothetical protein
VETEGGEEEMEEEGGEEGGFASAVEQAMGGMQ